MDSFTVHRAVERPPHLFFAFAFASAFAFALALVVAFAFAVAFALVVAFASRYSEASASRLKNRRESGIPLCRRPE
jgi:hypothetical protein